MHGNGLPLNLGKQLLVMGVSSENDTWLPPVDEIPDKFHALLTVGIGQLPPIVFRLETTTINLTPSLTLHFTLKLLNYVAITSKYVLSVYL